MCGGRNVGVFVNGAPETSPCGRLGACVLCGSGPPALGPEKRDQGDLEMVEHEKLNRPWLVAVWPGMGQVAISAGYYLMSKLGMHQLAEMEGENLFDVEHISVKQGIIAPATLPRSRFFVWRDPAGFRDIVVFLGEAQPPQGKYAFCRRLMSFAKELGVEQVFTFAAMATEMHPTQDARVFCAATDEGTLDQLKKLELDVLENGQIGGLNGVLLAAASELDLPGACLLGEMPSIFAQFPFPKASVAILRAFRSLANIDVDLAELEEQAQEVEQKLSDLLANFEQAMQAQRQVEEPPESEVNHDVLSKEDRALIEDLFEKARSDRAHAYELKSELDRLGVFSDYEDRFLDLFQQRD